MGRYAQASRRGSSGPVPAGSLPVPVLVALGGGEVTWSVSGPEPDTARIYTGLTGGPYTHHSDTPWVNVPYLVATVDPSCVIVGTDGSLVPVTAQSNEVDLA